MEFVQQATNRSHLAVSGCDCRVGLGYAAFAIVALAAVYFASGGSGVTETELTTVLP